MLNPLHSNAYDSAHEYFSLCETDIPLPSEVHIWAISSAIH